MTSTPEVPPRIAELLARIQARKVARTETRRILTERRNHGLARRHARKLARDG
jgi:hypothetical protein